MCGQHKSSAQKSRRREEENRDLRDFLNKYLKKLCDSEVGTSKVNAEQGKKQHRQRLPETDHTLNFSAPALWPARMTNSDRVKLVCVMGQRTPFSERAKELPADAEGRANYLTYSTSHNGREKIDRDWIVYSSSEKALFCLPC